jgi:hypothetical protein
MGTQVGMAFSGRLPRKVFQINRSFGDILRLHNQSVHQIMNRDDRNGVRVGLRNTVGLNYLRQLSAKKKTTKF